MNLNINGLVIASVMAFGITACDNPAKRMLDAGATRLTMEEVAGHISGNTEIWSRGGGYYHPNGNLDVIWEDATTSGKYTIDANGVVCTTTYTVSCHYYLKFKGDVILISDRKKYGTNEILSGNMLSQLK